LRNARAQEIGEIISQRMKLEANGVGGEGTAGKPGCTFEFSLLR
jgi:hypothetical protein